MAATTAKAAAPIPPNQTLYVTNLPSAKIQKDDLKTALYMLFSTYGPILDVVALKTMKMRGQAHIVYRDLQAATQAMRSLEGAEFLGRELRIQYAKSKSDTIAKLDGTYKIPGTATTAAEMTATQQSIFNAPIPGSAAANTTTSTPAAPSTATAAHATGQKRVRDEDDDEDGSDSDVAMEEDSDEE
ncbi:U2 small nuclear ribonucleoprotein B'' [Microdochium nivale]|nr:U2 small nuclear ribonucleoprotein B'' [Microdochium nivale]